MSNFSFDDVLTVHPTELNIPLDTTNKKTSCSFQLTNKTDRTVAFSLWPLGRIILLFPDAIAYVGTIIPQSTRTVIVTVKLMTEPALDGMQSICIYAYVVKDGVKAEDITSENLFDLTAVTHESFTVPVVPAANLTSEGKRSKSSVRTQSSNERSKIELFSEDEIKSATNDLSDNSKIGNGGYGTVYRGSIRDTEVAIKILDSSSEQGIIEFHQEMEVLGRLKHQYLVKLIGVCIQSRALVYEFLPHGSVEDYLKKDPSLLTWQRRTRIVYEICSALTFLHSRQPQAVVHGDLKPANILLDANFISKLSDFGLCRFLPRGTTTTTAAAFHKTENIKGTEWYIDPDFIETEIITTGCDVYSFGITMLRLLTGAPPSKVLRYVHKAIGDESLMSIVDSTAGKWPENVAKYLARMGLDCCEPERRNSKLMKDLSTDLEGILAKINACTLDIIN